MNIINGMLLLTVFCERGECLSKDSIMYYVATTWYGDLYYQWSSDR